MLKIEHLHHPNELVCSVPVAEAIDHTNFQYFDKDGYTLNQAEKLYYTANNLDINTGYLNKSAWMTYWLHTDPENSESRFFVDHSFCTYRCNYRGDAEEQIKEYAVYHVEAKQMLQIRPKWGFEFNINAVSPTGEIFELLHIKYDTYFYKDFNSCRGKVEDQLLSTDWHKAADEIWDRRLEWSTLAARKQNNWKARLLLGWEHAEHAEKALVV